MFNSKGFLNKEDKKYKIVRTGEGKYKRKYFHTGKIVLGLIIAFVIVCVLYF